MLSARELKDIKNDAHYGLRQLLTEIEDLKQQLDFVSSENELLKSQIESQKLEVTVNEN